MTEPEIVACLEKNYKPRRRQLALALHDGARRTDSALRTGGECCVICGRRETGGGLIVYRLRDGQDLLLGHRCAEYLDYLIEHPEFAAG
jgi:hypothetical protein